jgi:hypothetical protein
MIDIIKRAGIKHIKLKSIWAEAPRNLPDEADVLLDIITKVPRETQIELIDKLYMMLRRNVEFQYGKAEPGIVGWYRGKIFLKQYERNYPEVVALTKIKYKYFVNQQETGVNLDI